MTNQRVAILPDDARTDRLLELADLLDKHPEKLNMRYIYGEDRPIEINKYGAVRYKTVDEFVHTCNSAACIQGWFQLMLFDQNEYLDVCAAEVATRLGLDEESFDAMCCPTGLSPQGVEYLWVKDGHIAAEFLRKTVETRRVDWSVVDHLIDA